MTALLVKPVPYTVVGSDADALYPVTNANLDQPGLVWRRTGTSMYCVIDVGDNVAYDTIALMGCNVSGSSNSVTITTGTASNGIGVRAVPAGNFPLTRTEGVSAKYVHHNTAMLADGARYIKITISAINNPVAFLEVQRIVVGRSVNCTGIDIDPEQSFEDQSIINEGPGWVSVDPYPVLPTWKFTVSWVSDTTWRNNWFPFFTSVGMSKGFFFIPNYEASIFVHQTEAMFGRMTGNPSGKHPAHDMWTAECEMKAFAP